MRKTLLAFGLIAALAGCHPPLIRTITPEPSRPVALRSEQGRIAVTIQWPYRTQLIPSSTEQLRFSLTGPSAKSLLLTRPTGTAPTSTASLPVDIGVGYSLGVEALARSSSNDSEPTLVVASGQSDPFDVLANKVTPVRVVLLPLFMPAITGFFPTNGGPETYVTVHGTNFGSDSWQVLGFRFGGMATTPATRIGEGTASVRVPEGAMSSEIVPIADGVTGTASGSFTVLSELGITPASRSIASGSSFVFTAEATSTEGTAFLTPTVYWYVSSASLGAVDQAGRFTATGTGSCEVQVFSGRLIGTASVTVP